MFQIHQKSGYDPSQERGIIYIYKLGYYVLSH